MVTPRVKRFGKRRAKDQASTLFESPELLLKAACEYFDWCDCNTWFKHEAVKSGAECGRIIDIPLPRPYSLSGLCVYLGCSRDSLYQFKQNCSTQFSEIIEQIEDMIETQQFEGAAVGVFNSSIIARKQGLGEQTDITSNGKTIFRIEVLDNNTKEQLDSLKLKLKS